MAQESKSKVVIRKLPPYLKQEAFLEAVNKNFEGAYDWFSYYPGKLSHRRLVHSRAYINFNSPELVYDFHESFNGHIFVNEKGVQFRAEVEYAPYQKIPKGRNKKDAREGTIFEDPDYLTFLAELENPKPSISSADAQKEEAEKAASKGPIITPLIQYIREKRANRAAGREKVGPRASSRDAARKAPFGVTAGRSVKSAVSDKGILDRKGPSKDESARKSSSRTDGKSRRDSSSASESEKNDAPSQRSSRSTPADPTGILKRPSTPENETTSQSSDRRKDASSRGGPEKRIVKGALASIIGGGLGRPPRGSRKSVPEQGPLPAEPSGWGDNSDGTPVGEAGLGGTGDWGTDNPLAAKQEKAGKKESSSRRGSSRSRQSGGATQGDAPATGWDDVSEGLLKTPVSVSKREGPRGEAASGERGGASDRSLQGGAESVAPRMKILQRDRVGSGRNAATPQTAGENRSGEKDLTGSGATRPDGPYVADSKRNAAAETARSGGRGQQLAGSQPPRSRDEGPVRGGGRGSRQRVQGRGQLQPSEVISETSAAARAAWAAISGAAPAAQALRPASATDEPTSARSNFQPSAHSRVQSDVIKVSESNEAPRGGSSGPQVRIMPRSGGATVPVSQGPPIPNNAHDARGMGGGEKGPTGAGEQAPFSQQSVGALGRGQPRPGRQPRYQGPYQPGGRGSGRGGRLGTQLRQARDSSEGGDSAGAAHGGVASSGTVESGAGGERGGVPGGLNGMSASEAAAAKKQMWVAVQKPG